MKLNITEYVSAIVRTTRLRKNVPQEELGSRLGCSGSYVNKLERGQAVPSARMAKKLEIALFIPYGSISAAVREYKDFERGMKDQSVKRARMAKLFHLRGEL